LFIPELKRPPPVAAVLVLRPKFENGVLAVEVAPKAGAAKLVAALFPKSPPPAVLVAGAPNPKPVVAAG